MFLDENLVTINGEFNKRKNGAIADAYLNQYVNTFPLDPKVASPDYVKYITRSLIERGYLFKYSNSLDFLYKATLEEIFDNKFKDLFLYSLDRNIESVYSSVEDIKNMGPVGTFDLLSSMITLSNARLLPVFEIKPISEEDILERLTINEKDLGDKYEFIYKQIDTKLNGNTFLISLNDVSKHYLKIGDTTFRRCTVDDFFVVHNDEDGFNYYKFKPCLNYYVCLINQKEKPSKPDIPQKPSCGCVNCPNNPGNTDNPEKEIVEIYVHRNDGISSSIQTLKFEKSQMPVTVKDIRNQLTNDIIDSYEDDSYYYEYMGISCESDGELIPEHMLIPEDAVDFYIIWEAVSKKDEDEIWLKVYKNDGTDEFVNVRMVNGETIDNLYELIEVEYPELIIRGYDNDYSYTYLGLSKNPEDDEVIQSDSMFVEDGDEFYCIWSEEPVTDIKLCVVKTVNADVITQNIEINKEKTVKDLINMLFKTYSSFVIKESTEKFKYEFIGLTKDPKTSNTLKEDTVINEVFEQADFVYIVYKTIPILTPVEQWNKCGETNICSSIKLLTENYGMSADEVPVDQSYNQSKVNLSYRIDDVGMLNLEIWGNINGLKRWLSTDRSQQDSTHVWLAINLRIKDDVRKALTYNGLPVYNELDDNDLTLWVKLDELYFNPKIITLTGKYNEETGEVDTDVIRISFDHVGDSIPQITDPNSPNKIKITVCKNDGSDAKEEFIVDKGYNYNFVYMNLPESLLLKEKDENYEYELLGITNNLKTEELINNDYEFTEDTWLYMVWKRIEIIPDEDPKPAKIIITVLKNDGSNNIINLYATEGDTLAEFISNNRSYLKDFLTRESDEYYDYIHDGFIDLDTEEKLDDDYRFEGFTAIAAMWKGNKIVISEPEKVKVTIYKNDNTTKNITITCNSGISIKDFVKEYDSEIKMLANRLSDKNYDYTYNGLFVTPDDDGIDDEVILTKNTNLYIIWKATPIKKMYTISINKNDKSGSIQEVTFINEIDIEELMSKVDETMLTSLGDEYYEYKFKGISETYNGDTLDNEHKFYDSCELFCIWDKTPKTNDILITIHKNDGSNQTQILNYKDVLVNPDDDITINTIIENIDTSFKHRANTDLETFDFIGLSKDGINDPLENTMKITESCDLYCTWSVSYKYNYHETGETEFVDSITISKLGVEPENLPKTNYNQDKIVLVEFVYDYSDNSYRIIIHAKDSELQSFVSSNPAQADGPHKWIALNFNFKMNPAGNITNTNGHTYTPEEVDTQEGDNTMIVWYKLDTVQNNGMTQAYSCTHDGKTETFKLSYMPISEGEE